MSGKPTVHYWHLWVDGEGVSHQTKCAMERFHLDSIQPSADPQWLGEKIAGQTSTLVTILPVGWKGDWHENPKPQWIIPLSGCWFVEAMDGSRVELGIGELSFGADQGCSESDGKRGHRSGTVGDAPAILMLVQFEMEPAPRPPCHSRGPR